MIQHLAIIMDGNRRWAKQRHMFPWLGHRQGAKTMEMVTQYCLDKQIPYLSLYTLSLENLNRSEQELSYLFLLIEEAFGRVHDFIKADIQVRFVGDISRTPQSIQQICHEFQQQTAHCSKLTCSFLFCYGGQQEIVQAVEQIIKNPPAHITLEKFKSYLWTGNIPEPTIIIRTGGVKRLSNFLLFQAAYTEIRFLDCLWPELTEQELDQTIQHCIDAQKNFGH